MLDWIGKKVDLRDMTFTIPVSYDHPDRKENMELCLAFLLTHFDTNVVIGEQDGRNFEYLKEYCEYRHFDGMAIFHRTKMLNDMARDAETPFVANYDCDVLLAPMQILQALTKSGAFNDCTGNSSRNTLIPAPNFMRDTSPLYRWQAILNN